MQAPPRILVPGDRPGGLRGLGGRGWIPLEPSTDQSECVRQGLVVRVCLAHWNRRDRSACSDNSRPVLMVSRVWHDRIGSLKVAVSWRAWLEGDWSGRPMYFGKVCYVMLWRGTYLVFQRRATQGVARHIRISWLMCGSAHKVLAHPAARPSVSIQRRLSGTVATATMPPIISTAMAACALSNNVSCTNFLAPECTRA